MGYSQEGSELVSWLLVEILELLGVSPFLVLSIMVSSDEGFPRRLFASFVITLGQIRLWKEIEI